VPNLVPDGLHRPRRWSQVEDGGPDWGIPTRDPKKSAQAAIGFTRQAVGIRLGRGFLGQRRWADRRELPTIRLTG
jgi:hypothetical protein